MNANNGNAEGNGICVPTRKGGINISFSFMPYIPIVAAKVVDSTKCNRALEYDLTPSQVWRVGSLKIVSASAAMHPPVSIMTHSNSKSPVHQCPEPPSPPR